MESKESGQTVVDE